MKNKFIYKMKSKINVEVSGKTLERFLLRLNKNNVNIYKIKRLTNEKCEIVIDYNDFEKLLKLNTIYEIKIKNYLGFEKNKRILLKKSYVIFIFIFCIILLYLLHQVIFKLEIITNDEDMKKKLTSSLQYYDVKEFHFKKSYNYIQEVKEKILEEYHDKIEWIEIEKKGTRYIIRYEPRVIKSNESSTGYRHVIAKKNAVIKSIYASSGQILKNKNSYVKKGDIIISGYIYSNDEVKETIRADGNVYGEVWYDTKVIYPFNYYEEEKTGNKKNIYSIKFLNNEIELFNFTPFNDKIEVESILLKNSILPISFSKKKQEEVIINTGMHVKEELEIKAIELAYDKMQKSLKDNEYIISHRVLDSKIIDKGIEMKIFFSVCENISDYIEIEEMKEVD